ncbi:hypothetical protein ABFA07_001850 [Porites harrisoni]
MLLFVTAFGQMVLCQYPLHKYFDSLAKQDPGNCKYNCLYEFSGCYDAQGGSYNYRTGNCGPGKICCEWVPNRKRNEPNYDAPDMTNPWE